jgi:hypothetical protein
MYAYRGQMAVEETRGSTEGNRRDRGLLRKNRTIERGRGDREL